MVIRFVSHSAMLRSCPEPDIGLCFGCGVALPPRNPCLRFTMLCCRCNNWVNTHMNGGAMVTLNGSGRA